MYIHVIRREAFAQNIRLGIVRAELPLPIHLVVGAGHPIGDFVGAPQKSAMLRVCIHMYIYMYIYNLIYVCTSIYLLINKKYIYNIYMLV